ncbi:MAG: BatA domain-containing protein [Planctomycetes bacterium]|nr:BatA domain-containing protein [Planctomycetota bacterium]
MSVHPLIAFGFASPWLLGGLVLGGIPIVIHLLHKRQYKTTDWAAMRFLMAAIRRNARRLRLEQLILLAVRTAILLLLALALAQPYVEALGTVWQADVPMHRVIVVDASFSMGYRPAEFSRFERARAAARAIVDEASQGDAFNLLAVAGNRPPTIVRRASFQRSQVLEEIDQLRPTDERGDLATALEAAVDLLRTEAPDIEQKDVYIISDLQRQSWSPADAAAQARLRRAMGQIDKLAGVVVLDVGSDPSPNAALTSFVADEPFITTGRPVTLHASVRNFGGALLSEQQVELRVDDRLAGTAKVSVPPGTEAPVDFTYTFESSGEHRLEVRLAGDSLAADDRRWLVLPVRDQLNVLLVNGRPGGRSAENATFYLETVLAPSTQRQRWRGVTQPRVIRDGELAATDLSLYDCIVLTNVALFTDREAELLNGWVESGGGLVVVLGDQVNVENYNRLLYRDGQGLLPAKLNGRRGNAENSNPAETDIFHFDAAPLDHPIVEKFEGNPAAGLDATLVLEYIRAEVPQDSPARIAVRYQPTGDPAIITDTRGRGRVVLVTTSADNRWGPWPMQASFAPLAHETVRFAVSGRWADRQLQVGEPIVESFPTRAFDVQATVARPDGSEKTVRLAEDDGLARLRYEETGDRGLYRVELGRPLSRTEWFAANVDTRESDLSRATAADLEGGLMNDLDFELKTGWQDLDRQRVATTPERGGLTRGLLWAVLGLLFVELLMAWKFSAGLLLLGALAAAGALLQTAALSAAAAITLLALAALFGGVVLVRHTRRKSGLSRA